jgi:hypothetical protein
MKYKSRQKPFCRSVLTTKLVYCFVTRPDDPANTVIEITTALFGLLLIDLDQLFITFLISKNSILHGVGPIAHAQVALMP